MRNIFKDAFEALKGVPVYVYEVMRVALYYYFLDEDSPGYLFKGPDRLCTTKIIILGQKMCGKTELWCKLQGIENKSNGGTSFEEVKPFKLSKEDGTIVEVRDSYDIGGGDDYVECYKKLINENGVFIYYLVSLDRIGDKEYNDETRARLYKIGSIIYKSKLEKCGITIIGTFLDKFKGSPQKAKEHIRNSIFNNQIKFIGNKIPIHVINTKNDDDVKIIKNELLRVTK